MAAQKITTLDGMQKLLADITQAQAQKQTV